MKKKKKPQGRIEVEQKFCGYVVEIGQRVKDICKREGQDVGGEGFGGRGVMGR